MPSLPNPRALSSMTSDTYREHLNVTAGIAVSPWSPTCSQTKNISTPERSSSSTWTRTSMRARSSLLHRLPSTLPRTFDRTMTTSLAWSTSRMGSMVGPWVHCTAHDFSSKQQNAFEALMPGFALQQCWCAVIVVPIHRSRYQSGQRGVLMRLRSPWMRLSFLYDFWFLFNFVEQFIFFISLEMMMKETNNFPYNINI